MFLCCSTARVAGQGPRISAPTISFQLLCRASLKGSSSHPPESLSICVLRTEGFVSYMNFTHPQQWKSYWKTSKGFGVCSFTRQCANGKRATKAVTVPSSFPTIHALHRYHKISFLHRHTLHCVTSRCCPTVVHVQLSAAILQQMFLFMLQSVNILPSAETHLSSIFEVQRTA